MPAASLILGYFAAGDTIKGIIAEFPDIDTEPVN
ncbi:MAG TPA: hypothetical protein ENG35_04355 [Desulfobacteraceae bacterium]|nr:hypothetical protein [Desulfobacteraceae bacterium]